MGVEGKEVKGGMQGGMKEVPRERATEKEGGSARVV